MSVVLFLVLALVVAAPIALPLLPGRRERMSAAAPAVGDVEIARVVAGMRQARSGQPAPVVAVSAAPAPVVAASAASCPACGHAYRPGDRFCVQCGGSLPHVPPSASTCASCGAPLRPGDRFCARCGHDVAAGKGD